MKVPVMSPRISEFLVKTTHSKDIDDALNKVFTEYIELKLKTLQEKIIKFQKKWGMNFEDFEMRFSEGTLKDDSYSLSTENDFWEWEEAETLKKHYEEIERKWI